MRYPIYGSGVASSSIKVFEDDGVTIATIYTEESGGVAVADGIITADSGGNFVFFVDDADYPVISYFDIYFYASGNTQEGVWSFFVDAELSTPPPSPTPESAVTELQIYNAALMAVGANPLVTVSDTTTQANVVRTMYTYCRDSLLRAHPWNFAERRVLLTPVVGGTPPMDFARYFNLPVDCLKLRRLSDEAVDVAYKVEGRRILCDESSISILYTYRVTDTTHFDSLFVECLIAMLAWKIAYPIKANLALMKAKGDEYRDAFFAATGVDAQEGTPDVPQCDDLLKVR